MFGEKAQQIETLTTENGRLRTNLEALESDPWWGVVNTMRAQAEDIVRDGVDVDGRITAMIHGHTEAYTAQRISEVAREKADQAITARKEQIELEVVPEADAAAEELLEQWLTNEEPAYRTKVRAELTTKRAGELTREARDRVRKEEHEKIVAAHADELRLGQQVEASAKVSQAELKRRARLIREQTKVSKVLQLSDLRDDDPLVLAFVNPGRGFENLTDYSTYRSYLERRKLVGRLVDAVAGTFEVEKDLWRGDARLAPEPLRGGTKVTLLATNPLAHTTEEEPILVKGAPITIRSLGKVVLPQAPLDLWWAALDEYRVLS